MNTVIILRYMARCQIRSHIKLDFDHLRSVVFLYVTVVGYSLVIGMFTDIDYHSGISLLLPRVPKLTNQCYSHGPGNLGNMGSNKEIQSKVTTITEHMDNMLCQINI